MSNKYELLAEPGTWLKRIRYIKDIPAAGVKAGDLGGLLESEANLSQEGSCVVLHSAKVTRGALVSGDAQVYGNTQVYGDAWIHGNAQVYGNAHVYWQSHVYDSAQVYGEAQIYGHSHICGNARENKIPITLQLTKRSVTLTTDGLCSVGGTQHPLSFWIEHYEEIGAKNNCSAENIKLYGDVFKLLYRCNILGAAINDSWVKAEAPHCLEQEKLPRTMPPLCESKT